MPDEVTVYKAEDRVRMHMLEAADEGALFIRKMLRDEIETNKETLAKATQARAAMGAFTRYEATISNREQTSVIVSKMLAGDDRESFQRYIAASMPDHPAVRVIKLLTE